MKKIIKKMNPLGCVKCTESSIWLSFADLAKVTHANGLNIFNLFL